MVYRRKERDREIGLPDRISLRLGLRWLTKNLALIIHCLSRNDIWFQIYIPRKMFSYTHG
jgi:hypothetical protein